MCRGGRADCRGRERLLDGSVCQAQGKRNWLVLLRILELQSCAAVAGRKCFFAHFIGDFGTEEIKGWGIGAKLYGEVGIFAGKEGIAVAEEEVGSGGEGFYIGGMAFEVEVEAVSGFLRLAEGFEIEYLEEPGIGIEGREGKDAAEVGIDLGEVSQLAVGFGLQEEGFDGGGGVEGLLGEGEAVVEGGLRMLEREMAYGTVATGLFVGGKLAQDVVKFSDGFVDFSFGKVYFSEFAVEDIVAGGFGAQLEGTEEALAGLCERVGMEVAVGAGEAVGVVEGVLAEGVGRTAGHGIVVHAFGADGGSSAMEVDDRLRRGCGGDADKANGDEVRADIANHRCKGTNKRGYFPLSKA